MCLQHKGNNTSKSNTETNYPMSCKHYLHTTKNGTITIHRGWKPAPFYTFHNNFSRIIITTTNHLNQERSPQTHDWIQISISDLDKYNLLFQTSLRREIWNTCRITGIINKENNQYQLQMEKHGQLITTTLEPNSAWEFKPHFQSRTAFRSRINRNYNRNHDNNISYANSKPQVMAFIPSNMSPKNRKELQNSKNTNPMEYPKGIIINGDRLREILLIKENPEKRCNQLCDTRKQDLQTLTNKLINLYQAEH